MTRLYVSVLALAMLAALLSGCGGAGKEEATSLAVAFRLDEGFPVMVAYVGDPAEDPWQLPAGRYYIEALDQDDVLLSLGAVDIEDGDVVDFPPSFAAAGGVADPQRAQPLFTLTSFLVDLELAKYKLLEIVTAGFTESPFGSAVEPDDASVQQLFAMYGDIAAQEDAVLAALSQIESRLGVSSGASYVCTSWALAPDDLDRTEIQVAFFVALLIRAQQMGEAADSPGEACGEGACWVIPLQGECFGVDSPQQRLTKTPEMLAMFNKWQEYAGKLVQDLGLTPDKASPGQARKELREKVNSDLKQRWGSDTPPYVIDQVADFFVNEVAKVVPELASVPAPGPGQAKADTFWIEGFAQKVADRLLDQGHSGLDVAVWADDLRHCLTQYVQQGLSQEDAAAVCVWLVEGFIVQRLEPTSEEPTEPEPEEPTEPEPEEPTEPEPEEPAEPEPEEPTEPEPEEPTEPEPEEPTEPEPTEPEPEDVTAVGQYTRAQSPGYVVVKNTMTLTFNTAGGLVEGDGEKDVQTPDDQGCGTGMIYGTYEYEGTYYPETKTFDGTFTVVGDGYFMSRSSDCDFVDDELVCECKSVPWGDTFSGDWQAALEDGVVQGSQTVQVDTFELTVQG